MSEVISFSSIEQQALDLLGSGQSQAIVASCLGISESRISQLMAEEDFRSAVLTQRVAKLREQTARDIKVDTLEDKVITKLDKTIALCHKPGELARIYQILNQAKRRGAPESAPTSVTNVITNLVVPAGFMQHFRKNAQSQIIEVDGKPLITAQSSSLATIAVENNNESAIKITAEHSSQVSKVNSGPERKSYNSYDTGSEFCIDDL